MIVKADGDGSLQWNKTYGDAYDNQAYSMIQTSDGGFAFTGETKTPVKATNNYWLVKTDASGNAEWNKTNDGDMANFAYSLIQTRDGGFALAGETDTETMTENALLVKLNGTGSSGELSLLPVAMAAVVALVIVLAVVVYVVKKRAAAKPNEHL